MITFVLLSLTALALGLPVEDSKGKRSADPGLVSSYDPGLALSPVAIGGGSLVSQLVEVQNNVAVSQPVGVAQPVPVPLPVPVPRPVPVSVPVPVPVVKTVSVPVERPVPYPVIRKVPVEIIRKVPVAVPQPYPVKVPIYKTRHIYYDVVAKKARGGWW